MKICCQNGVWLFIMSTPQVFMKLNMYKKKSHFALICISTAQFKIELAHIIHSIVIISKCLHIGL